MNTLPNDLVGGGDCFLHFHSEDRKPTQDMLHGLQGISRVVSINSSADASLENDFYLVDSTAAPVTLALPLARGNRLVTFVRVAGSNPVTLQAQVSETVNGASSIVVSLSYSPIRLLALRGVGYIQV